MPGSKNEDLFPAQTADIASPERKLLLKLEIPGRLPSWNELLGMEHWQRYKLKAELQKDFLSALRACDDGFSMKTTCAKSITSIAADTLASYLEMSREKRKLKLLKKKLEKANANTLV